MTGRDLVLATLRTHQAELQAAGISHLSLFGSVARGDTHAQSDIDLLADFNEGRRPSLLAFSGLQNRLSEMLGEQVDLSATAWLKEQLRPEILLEAVRVF